MKLRNLLAVSVTAFTLLSCNDSDNNLNPAPNQGELAAITVKVKGNADTRALTGEETGSANENDINSLEFFVFNNDGSFQKYYKPTSVVSDNQYTFLVNAGNLTILIAANQNLGEPSPAPASLADFKKSSLYKALSLDGTNSRSDISASLGFAMAAEGTANVVEGETNKLSLSVRRLLSKIENPKADPANKVTAPDADLLKILGLDASGTVPTDLKWTFNGYTVINGINRSLTFEYDNLINWERFATASNFKTTFTPDGATVETVYSVKAMTTAKPQTASCRPPTTNRSMYTKTSLPCCKAATDRQQQYSTKMK